MLPYRLQKARGPVLVYRQESALLCNRRPRCSLLRPVSIRPQLRCTCASQAGTAPQAPLEQRTAAVRRALVSGRQRASLYMASLLLNTKNRGIRAKGVDGADGVAALDLSQQLRRTAARTSSKTFRVLPLEKVALDMVDHQLSAGCKLTEPATCRNGTAKVRSCPTSSLWALRNSSSSNLRPCLETTRLQ